MQTNHSWKEIVPHVVALIATLLLVLLTDQNPRVLVYALAFSLLYRFITVTVLSSAAMSSNRGSRVCLLSREPADGERSRAYRDQRTGRKAGLAAYISGMLGVFMMLAVTFEMTSASGIAHPGVMVADLKWGALLGLIYLIDDLWSRQIIIAPGQPVPVNLGYNVSGLNFLIAAIFISAFLFALVMVVLSVISTDISYTRISMFEWIVFVILVIIRCVYDINRNFGGQFT